MKNLFLHKNTIRSFISFKKMPYLYWKFIFSLMHRIITSWNFKSSLLFHKVLLVVIMITSC